jgi:hypothetical protein
MARQVELDVSYQEEFVPGEHDGFAMRIESYCDGLPNEIFRCRQLPLKPGTTEYVGVFDGICTSVDLEDLPADNPRENETPPWYRVAAVELIFPTRDEAEQFLASLQISVAILIRSLDAQDHLVQTLRVVITSDGADSGSSSSQSSQSA